VFTAPATLVLYTVLADGAWLATGTRWLVADNAPLPPLRPLAHVAIVPMLLVIPLAFVLIPLVALTC
jgi:hypothetical protein